MQALLKYFLMTRMFHNIIASIYPLKFFWTYWNWQYCEKIDVLLLPSNICTYWIWGSNGSKGQKPHVLILRKWKTNWNSFLFYALFVAVVRCYQGSKMCFFLHVKIICLFKIVAERRNIHFPAEKATTFIIWKFNYKN